MKKFLAFVLAAAFSLSALTGNLRGLRVAIVGDIEHSRVARSNAFGLAAAKYG